MREQARSLMKKREIDENARLDNIERKLSSIEHRLSFIEEQSEEAREMRKISRSVHINDRVDVETISNSSSESGIHEDEMRNEDYDSDMEREYDEDHLSDRRHKSRLVSQPSQETIELPLRKVEIHPRKPESAGVQIWDILAHEQNATGTETMLKLFQTYPNVHARARLGWEKDAFETATELTLGVPRKIRRAKMKSGKKNVKAKSKIDDGLVGKEIGRSCRYCKCKGAGVKQNDNKYVPRDNKMDHLKQSFPVRKPSIRVVVQHPPVECDCRLDPRRSQGVGPLLAVTGTQVPLFDRDFLCT